MSAMEKLLAKMKQAKAGKTDRADDQYFYYPSVDKETGNGQATIRFLPAVDEDSDPWAKLYRHQFKGPSGKWYIENCPSTIGEECPCCAQNSTYYSTLSKDDARKKGLNRKLEYISRILVVEDKKNPENEGKQFLYKYGSKIFDKLLSAMSPEFDDEAPLNLWDLKEGANFKLKIRKVDGNTNYDKSEFDSVSVCKFTPEYTPEFSIEQFISKDKFKDAEALKTRLDLALGNTNRVKKEESEDDEEFDTPKPTKPKVRKEVVESDDEDDEMLAMMRKLAEED